MACAHRPAGRQSADRRLGRRLDHAKAERNFTRSRAACSRRRLSQGSPFEHVITSRTSFRHSLERLDSGRDHPVLFELAEAGSTDYLALPIEYGDGSVQVGAFTTDRPGGFADGEVALIEALAPAIAAAMEPAAMRYSMNSLLEVYLGDRDPPARIVKGAFQRGQTTEIDAAVLVTDLRGFTGLSERLTPEALLDRLGPISRSSSTPCARKAATC